MMNETIEEAQTHPPIKTETVIVSISDLSYNPFNCNRMDDDTYFRLKNEVGLNNYDPIIIVSSLVFYGKEKQSKEYVVLDGEHRVKCAIDLGHTHMRCYVHQLSMKAALPYYYKRQSIHGVNDSFKESALFNYEREQGLTSRQIAEKYGHSRAYIQYRQSLKNLHPDVLKYYVSGSLSISHLEVIASEQEDLQVLLANEAVLNALSVKDLASLKKNLKKDPKPRKRLSYGSTRKAQSEPSESVLEIVEYRPFLSPKIKRGLEKIILKYLDTCGLKFRRIYWINHALENKETKGTESLRFRR